LLLRTVGWLTCVVYSTIPAFWLVIHARAESWRSRPRSPYLLLAPLWAAMWIAVAVVTFRWRTDALYASPWGWLPALGLFALGFWLYHRAGADFGLKRLTGVPELHANHAEQSLVTAGIRAHVRHPVYLAHLCEMLAWSAGTGLLVCFGLTLFAGITGAAMIRAEDAELERRFGEAYRAYRSTVPAVLPRLR
jgi:protein-S-isoprenylcysteine O-methyltransferase Ste14